MLPQIRQCANAACRRPFTTRHPDQRYCHPTHRPPKADRGTAHKQARRALLAHPPNGRPCPRCGQPMTNAQWAAGKLDAGHTIDHALGGGAPDRVEHATCNRSAGATAGNLRRRRATVRTSRAW